MATTSTNLFRRLQFDRLCLASNNTHDPYAVALLTEVPLLVMYAHAQTGTCLSESFLPRKYRLYGIILHIGTEIITYLNLGTILNLLSITIIKSVFYTLAIINLSVKHYQHTAMPFKMSIYSLNQTQSKVNFSPSFFLSIGPTQYSLYT